MLRLDLYKRGKHQIIKVGEDIKTHTDISELNSVIKWLLYRGKNAIAIQFTPDSFLGAKAVSLFVDCLEMIVEERGQLTIINPNTYMHDFLEAIDFDHVIRMCNTEDELVYESAVA